MGRWQDSRMVVCPSPGETPCQTALNPDHLALDPGPTAELAFRCTSSATSPGRCASTHRSQSRALGQPASCSRTSTATRALLCSGRCRGYVLAAPACGSAVVAVRLNTEENAACRQQQQQRQRDAGRSRAETGASQGSTECNAEQEEGRQTHREVVQCMECLGTWPVTFHLKTEYIAHSRRRHSVHARI